MKKTAKLFAAATALAATAALASAPASAAASAEHITVYVLRGAMGPKGPDGLGHDMFVPADFPLKVGTPVDLTIVNYDEGPHSITSKQMGLNIMVKPGHEQADGSVTPVTTEYSFTPTKKGVFRWHCAIPCDKGGKFWAMSKGYDGPDQDGYMAGYFVVM
jgi:plastocyanin